MSVPLRPGELDGKHETLRALEELVPEARIAGGSFAPWLPLPASVSVSGRAVLVVSTRQAAVDRCIRDLLQQVDADENTRIERGEGGERLWPAGFAGSLTHKGTVVLGVIAPTAAVSMIGIDLERADRDDLAGLESAIVVETFVPGLEPGLARLLTFSAKEAVFKAQYPVTRRSLGFSEVQLIWECGGDRNFRAAVRGPGEGLVIRASLVGRWIVSVAISSINTGR